MVLWLVPVLAALYGTVVLAMFLGQDRLIYFPDRTVAGDPGALGLAYRDVTITTEDDVTLHGWHVPADGTRFTALFCHGNAGDIGDRLDTVRILHDLGLSLLVFDYRGYGRSEGSPGEAGLYADARAVWRHLVEDEGIAPDRIVVWGRSLGGAVAAQLASEVEPAGLAVESTFTSAVDLARRHYAWLPVGRLLRSRFDAAAAVAGATCPKLFLHSLDDEIVPWALGVRLHEAAAPPKRLVALTGDHDSGFVESLAVYRAAVREFLDQLTASS
jgi:uncharacterized protein